MPDVGRKRQSEPTGWAKRIEALIDKHGEQSTADLLCMSLRTLKGLRYGEWDPSPAHQKLIELAEKGRLK